jgi:hypothetical protein
VCENLNFVTFLIFIVKVSCLAIQCKISFSVSHTHFWHPVPPLFSDGIPEKFQQVTSTRLVPASSLVLNRRYPILKAQRAETRYGPTVILTLKESDISQIKICLPKRYADTLKDDEINFLNSGAEALDLVSKGSNEESNSLVLALECRGT